MNTFLIVAALAAVANAIPTHNIGLIAIGHTQASSYKLKTDHPVVEPAPIIKGVPQPYAVPVPQPYAVPRAVPVGVPRAVPVTVTRTVPVPIIARGEPIVRTRVVQSQNVVLDGGLNGGLGLGGLDGGYGGLNGGYGGLNGGYGDLNGGYGGLGLSNGGYGKNIVLGDSGYQGLTLGKGLEYGLSDGLELVGGKGY